MKALLVIAPLIACSHPAPPPPAAAAPAAAAARITLAPSDVTTVWPMPASETERDAMLAATSVGRFGELLPASLYAVPVLDERDPAATDPHAERARLRVVAARFEPCRGSFGSAQETSCVNQLRLVMQVLRPGGGSSGSTMGANDGAVLAFYKLSREELLALARNVAALRAKYGGGLEDGPLGVHPLLAREGLRSAYARALQAELLAHAGAERLMRITFFIRTKAREPLWSFGAFDVRDGKAVPRRIATLDAEQQTLEGAGPRKVITPPTSSKDNPAALLGVFGRHDANDSDRAAYAAVLRIENPTLHNPDTMACAECHAAERMHATGDTLGLRTEQFASDGYRADVQSAAAGKIANENFHAVSYLGTNLAITTRTANDTSAVLAEMKTLL